MIVGSAMNADAAACGGAYRRDRGQRVACERRESEGEIADVQALAYVYAGAARYT